MPVRIQLTIEVLGSSKDGNLAILDRVIGATVHISEAKRIGRRLLSIVDTGTRPAGYRILTDDHETIFTSRMTEGDAPGL